MMLISPWGRRAFVTPPNSSSSANAFRRKKSKRGGGTGRDKKKAKANKSGHSQPDERVPFDIDALPELSDSEKRKYEANSQHEIQVSAPTHVQGMSMGRVQRDHYVWEPDQFDLIRKLGVGSFGEVWHAHHREAGVDVVCCTLPCLAFVLPLTSVSFSLSVALSPSRHHHRHYQAIKIMAPQSRADLIEMRREYEALKACDHEGVVSYYGVCQNGKELWIVLEFCDLGSLSNVMRVADRVLSEDSVAFVIRGLLQAVCTSPYSVLHGCCY